MWRVFDVFVTCCDVWDWRNKRKESSNNYIYKTSVHVRPLRYQFDKAVRVRYQLGNLLFFFGGIWFLKENTFHLEDIISVSRSSRTSYLPIYSIGLFDVAKNGIICIISQNSEFTWKLIFRTRKVHSLSFQKQQKVTPFYSF